MAGEVDKPARTFPRALLWAVLLVVLSYLLPTMAALGVMADPGDWELGYYGKVAQQARLRVLWGRGLFTSFAGPNRLGATTAKVEQQARFRGCVACGAVRALAGARVKQTAVHLGKGREAGTADGP